MDYGELFAKPFGITLIVAVILVWPLQIVMSRQGPRRLFGESLCCFCAMLGFALRCHLSCLERAGPEHNAAKCGQSSARFRSPRTHLSRVPVSRCRTTSDAQGKPVADKLGALPQDPPGCVSELTGWLKKTKPKQLMIIGRTDRRELSARAARVYDSNASLAFDRARTVIKWLDQDSATPDKPPTTPDTEHLLTPLQHCVIGPGTVRILLMCFSSHGIEA